MAKPDEDALSVPTRIAFAGDWHGNDQWARRAICFAKDQGADKVIHLGDFGYLFYERYLHTLSRTLEETGLQLLFIDGNHDDHRFLARQRQRPNGLRDVAPRVWYLPRGMRWEWAGISFLALGGAHSVDSTMRRRAGGAWWPEERITITQAAAAIDGGHADVMLTHDCPGGVDIPGLSDDWPAFEIERANEHRDLLRAVVEAVRPDWLWHGHYHVFHAQRVDLGWPLDVVGLDCDGTGMERNMAIIDLEMLRPAHNILGVQP